MWFDITKMFAGIISKYHIVQGEPRPWKLVIIALKKDTGMKIATIEGYNNKNGSVDLGVLYTG